MNELTLTAANAVTKLFIMLAAGFIAEKTGLLTRKVSDALTDVVVYLITPINAFSAFLGGYDPDKMRGMAYSVLAGVIFYVIALGAGFLLAPDRSRKNRKTGIGLNSAPASSRKYDFRVDRVCIAFSNCGFVGLPIAQTMFGAEGIIYIAIHRILFTLVFFTYGVILLEGEFSKEKLRKALLSPVVMFAIVGLILYVLRVNIPQVIAEPITTIGNCATPMAMIICGGIVARSDIKSVLGNPRAYLISLMRIVIIPVVTLLVYKLLVCRFMDLPKTVAVVAVIVAGCPLGTNAVFFIEKFGRDSAYASGIFGITTIACLVTIPLIVGLW